MSDAPRAHRAPMHLRFADIDSLGHVNNVTYAVYAETARVEFLAELGHAVRTIILARIALDFRRPIPYGAGVHVDTRVSRIGRTSIGLWQEIVADGVVAAEVESVVVFYDYESATPQPVPEATRHALAPYVMRSPPPTSSRA
jgi:acyl-CoA thioester hydrolase